MSIATLEIPTVPKAERSHTQDDAVELRGVSKGYGTGASRTRVLSNVDLRVAKGEFLAVCGFSGSGKTTLAKTLAGLLLPDQGEVLEHGKPVRGPGPQRGLVFQNYSLLPWLTVYGNVALAVDRVFAHWPKAHRKAHIEHFVEMVGLASAMGKRPNELSGGMRQRVSLARTLSLKPSILVLDEPLSALDALTRGGLQEQILKIWEEERQTCVLITNDVDEAIVMADRIVPLNPGPAATLGPAFSVSLARPRSRAALNHDPEFQQLRNQVTNYLVQARERKRQHEARVRSSAPAALPDIQPIDLLPTRRAIFAGPSQPRNG